MRARLISLAACGFTAAAGYYIGSRTGVPPARGAVNPSPAAAPAPPLQVGLVDLKRLFEAHPLSKNNEGELNARRAEAKAELQHLIDSGDNAAASRFRETRTRELDLQAAGFRQKIVADLRERVAAAGARHGLKLILDSSGNSLNAVPVVFQASGLVDLTEELLQDLKP